jgi:hypothetical protein
LPLFVPAKSGGKIDARSESRDRFADYASQGGEKQAKRS